MHSYIKQLTENLSISNKILVFTGAGVSTESGISDYRSKGGLWNRFTPVTIQEFMASSKKREEYWQTKLELYLSLPEAKPNAGHQAVVTLETLGRLRGVVTQNIDGLHQLAGSSPGKVLELHGNNRETICLSCGDLTPWEDTFERLNNGEKAPLCRLCSGFLKPNTISFGQALDPHVLESAFQWAADCDLCLALGSTLVVEPAASIPRIAKQNGAKLIIITLSETPLDGWADLKIVSPIGQVISAAVETITKEKV